ncbi:type II secretion system protein [Fervidobacterium islandicum]|uniref:type II secretion system protein n=1 Tax=Fervidobacterium islandicum TaxID=2423 RepID=UPI003A648354
MRKGFTLIELLIVLAVIAALMAVATPLAVNAVRNARATNVASNFRNIKTAIENYWHDKHPEVDEIKNAELRTLVDEGYLTSAPQGFKVNFTGTTDVKYKIEYDVGKYPVDKNKVQQIIPEVQEAGTSLTLEGTLTRWW